VSQGSPIRLIRSHNGLRGIAALLVVAYHLQYRVGHLAIEDATTFFARSYLMVDLFFVLSGFIMAYVHPVDAGSSLTASEVRSFWAKRVIRIYPLHLAVLLAMVAFSALLSAYAMVGGPNNDAAWSPRSLTMLGAQFLLINAWLGAPNGWNIPSWSISAEFVAYALFPLLTLLLSKRPRATIVVMIALTIAFYLVAPVRRSLDLTGGVAAPLRCLAGFGLGLVLHAYRERFSRLDDRSLGAAQIAALCWIALVMMIPSHDSLAIPAFVLLVGLTWPDRGIVARALGGRRLLWLGEISYAVYIMHLLVLSVLSFGWDRSFRRWIPDPSVERSIYIGVAYLAVIVAAGIAHEWFEKPVRRKLTGMLATRSRSRDAARR
jgi:peptidoglycan/LPS O-acetylase OafA/YrhL